MEIKVIWNSFYGDGIYLRIILLITDMMEENLFLYVEQSPVKDRM